LASDLNDPDSDAWKKRAFYKSVVQGAFEAFEGGILENRNLQGYLFGEWQGYLRMLGDEGFLDAAHNDAPGNVLSLVGLADLYELAFGAPITRREVIVGSVTDAVLTASGTKRSEGRARFPFERRGARRPSPRPEVRLDLNRTNLAEALATIQDTLLAHGLRPFAPATLRNGPSDYLSL
jgi:hypothetical protein